MHINYDFADLDAFLAVKETGSFHNAAARLSLSQSAVTRRIQKLETALDCVLFERSTRHVRPTLAAKRLQARAEAILADARETTRAMRDDSVAFAHQRSRVVTLAVLPSVVGLLPPAMATLSDQGPHIRLRLLDMAANEVAEAVANGDADLGIGALPMLEPNTTFAPLFDDQIGVALPEIHPLAKQPMLSWASLTELSLILPARGTGNRTLIDEAMARTGASLNWRFETHRSATALTLVASQAGIAMLPKSAVIEAPQVTWRPVQELHIARPIGLIEIVGQHSRAEVLLLKSALQKTLQTV